MKLHCLLAALVFAGCAQIAPPPEPRSVAKSARTARGRAATPEEQAALYVRAAAEASAQLGSAKDAPEAREKYNAAVADLAVLLRSADGGRLWNRPLTLSAGAVTYRVRFQPGNRQGVWSPNEFTSLVLTRDVPEKIITHPNREPGVGGTLVGVRKETPRAPFAPSVGVTAPVTATLDVQGHDATLALRDPSVQSQARVAGAVRPLAADFSAPLAFYPAPNETITGLMAAMHVGDYMQTTGLYTLQPYDPDRIPLIFVHGLISTARMWRNVINEVEMDPALRGRYQCWVFNYPTGNPVAYSAMRFREELAKAQKLYGFPRGFVLVGHSMGGIVSRMQVTTLDHAAWERGAPGMIDKLLAGEPKNGLMNRSLIFDANPNVRRVVFICTPHRGSEMAISTIGELGMRLISLPGDITSSVSKSAINTLSSFSGHGKILPNSVTSLSPRNPTLKVIDKSPMRVPHHTILGDRGKGNSPNSSDGVVPYWSSHLDTAQSQKIVPGPHGSCELPQTIEELKRILHLDLKTGGR